MYSDQSVRTARQHFVEQVRPGGPLPMLRIANQPYGFLPIVALDRWSPGSDDQGLKYLVSALRGLRDRVWLPSTARVPRVGKDITQTVEEAQSTMLQMLGTSPVCQQIFAREHVGRDYMINLWRFVSLNHDVERIGDVVFGCPVRQLQNATGEAGEPLLCGIGVDGGNGASASSVQQLQKIDASCAIRYMKASGLLLNFLLNIKLQMRVFGCDWEIANANK